MIVYLLSPSYSIDKDRDKLSVLSITKHCTAPRGGVFTTQGGSNCFDKCGEGPGHLPNAIR